MKNFKKTKDFLSTFLSIFEKTFQFV